MSDAWVYLESGELIKAKSFGANKTDTGVVVFNSSLSGIIEMISDESNRDIFINLALSEVGVSGANDEDMSSSAVACKGIFTRNYSEKYSNFRATMSLSQLLKRENKMGICDIDTRFITTQIRNNQSLRVVVSTEISDKDELKKILEQSK